MVEWKRIVLSTLLIVFGFILLFGQMLYGWLTFANVWSQRIYVILCTAVISLGHAFTQDTLNSKLKHGFLLFIALNVVMLLFGGFSAINDAINGTTITEGAGIYMAYDVLSTPFTSKALEFKIIVQTLIGTLPALILIFSVVSIWTADSPDETQGAVIEFIIVLVVIVSFSFFGNLFNFAWV